MARVITVSALHGLKKARSFGCACAAAPSLKGAKKPQKADGKKLCRVKFKYAGKVRFKIVSCASLKRKRKLSKKRK